MLALKLPAKQGCRHGSVDLSAPTILATPGLSPKHTIYACYNGICTLFAIVLRKGQKLTKSGRGIGPLKKQTTYRVSDLQVDNKLPTYYRVVMRKVSVNVTASGL